MDADGYKSEDVADHVPLGGNETPHSSNNEAGSLEEDAVPDFDDVAMHDVSDDAAIWEEVLADNVAAFEDTSSGEVIHSQCPFVVEMVQQAGNARRLVGAVLRKAGWKKVRMTPADSKDFILATTRIQRLHPDSGVE